MSAKSAYHLVDELDALDEADQQKIMGGNLAALMNTAA